MSVLDQIISMKKKGIPENEIISSLEEQGISPREISEALNQAKIKEAVSAETSDEEMIPSIMIPEKAEPLPTEGEISDVDLLPPTPSTGYTVPKIVRKEISEQEVPETFQETQEQVSDQYYQPQQPPPETYQYFYGETPQVSDFDTIIEISEQVFQEKIKALQKQIDSFNEFKNISQTKIDNISERLKRIENSLDSLQAAILEKIGDYGRGIDAIKKEMELIQESFHELAKSKKEKTVHKIEKKTTVVHKSKKKE
ncbi:MAG: hypothetical protein KatS3mg001_366 [Candidatus Pacearchaeota archaeon]|nr:MAG: hypothetical protein KatS3mg001_366 [Candidatus Pacearchaeota archaeon]